MIGDLFRAAALSATPIAAPICLDPIFRRCRQASIGSVADTYHNSLAETINGLYKTEDIQRCGPWQSFEAVELATLAWAARLNRRPLGPIGDIPPDETKPENATTTSRRRPLWRPVLTKRPPANLKAAQNQVPKSNNKLVDYGIYAGYQDARYFPFSIRR
jgi:hypothetical protein